MTIVREIVRGDNSPVEKCNTRGRGIRDRRKAEKQVSNDQSPHIEEQSRSKGGMIRKKM